MEKFNNLLNRLTQPFTNIITIVVQFCLGISFFLHGYGKLPMSEGFIGFLASKGVPFASISAYVVAWSEILAGIGIIAGAIIAIKSSILGNLITKLSSLVIVIVMISALFIAHSNWSIFIGEQRAILFASEQLFLLVLGLFFLVKGNNQ